MISRPEERDTHNVCFPNCNLFEFFMKQSRDCFPLVPSFTSFQEERETFAPRNKVSPAVQCPQRLPEINHRRRVCLVRACAPLPHLRISLCVLEYFLFEPLVPLAFCCGSDKHCSCHFVCLYCISVLSPCGEEVIVRHLYGCVTAGQMDM